MNLKRFRSYLPILIIILLACVLRLWQLGNVPISMSDDEIREVFQAYSIAHTGKDVLGNVLPVVFQLEGANTYGQVPIYISSLFFSFLPLNPFIARLPFALSGIISVVALYLIIIKTLNDNKIALLSAFVLSVSIWNIQITRIALEVDIAILMYLLGIVCFVYSRKKFNLLFLSMIFFLLGFYAYPAFKITLIPILAILCFYEFKALNRERFFLIFTTIVLAFGSFFFLNLTQNASRFSNGSEPFFFQNKNQTSLSVELERRASNEPQSIKTLYHNKFTYWFKIASTNYLTAFSPQYLFLEQEQNGIYSIWGRGEMYIFELPLLIIGFMYLFFRKRREFYLFITLLLICPLPSALASGTPTWSARSGFMPIFLSVFVGAGIYFLITFFKKGGLKYLTVAIIAVFYIYGVVGYLSQYYFDWSRTNAKYFSKSTKDLVYLINKYKLDDKKVLVAGATENTFLHYAFYNRVDPRLVQKNISKQPIVFDNFIFRQGCLSEIPKNIVYIAGVDCKYKIKPTSEIKAYNSGEVIWNIYEK